MGGGLTLDSKRNAIKVEGNSSVVFPPTLGVSVSLALESCICSFLNKDVLKTF